MDPLHLSPHHRRPLVYPWPCVCVVISSWCCVSHAASYYVSLNDMSVQFRASVHRSNPLAGKWVHSSSRQPPAMPFIVPCQSYNRISGYGVYTLNSIQSHQGAPLKVCTRVYPTSTHTWPFHFLRSPQHFASSSFLSLPNLTAIRGVLYSCYHFNFFGYQ